MEHLNQALSLPLNAARGAPSGFVVDTAPLPGGWPDPEGVPVAWAGIYLGVYFPLDLAGSALVAPASAVVMTACGPRCVPLLMRVLMPAHRRLLARLIKRGWVAK